MGRQRTILRMDDIELEIEDFAEREDILLPNSIRDMYYEILASCKDPTDIFAIQEYLYKQYVPLTTRIRRKIARLFSPIITVIPNKSKTAKHLNTKGLRPTQEWIPIAFKHLGYSDHTIIKFINDPAILKFVQEENYGESLDAVRFSIVLKAVKLYVKEQTNYQM